MDITPEKFIENKIHGSFMELAELVEKEALNIFIAEQRLIDAWKEIVMSLSREERRVNEGR